MQDFKFSDLSVGQCGTFSVVVTEADMQKFSEISGDVNPLHVDSEFARERGHAGRVVYGLLTASYYSRLVGHYLPGKNALLHSVEAGFLKPVYIGDTLTVKGEIVFLNEAFKQIEIQASILNQSGQKVSKAKIKAGCYV